MSVQGYRVPVHHALIQPMLVAGVPRSFAILNGTAAAAVLFGLHNPWLLPINIFLHLVVLGLTRRDPHLLTVVLRQLRLKTYYRV